jgi:MFS family permease
MRRKPRCVFAGSIMSEKQATSSNAQHDAPFPSPAHARWAVVVLLMLSALSYLDRQVLFLMVDRVKADLRLDDFKISLLQGFAFALFYGVFGLPFGWAVDRFSRRWIIFAGITIWAVAASACGLAHTFSQLLFARFLVGVGEAALSPAAFSLLSDTFPKHRLTMAIAVFAAGTNIGSGLAFAIGGIVVGLLPEHGATVPLVGHLANWQLVFLLTGLPCLAVGWLIFTVIEPLPLKWPTLSGSCVSTGASTLTTFLDLACW